MNKKTTIFFVVLFMISLQATVINAAQFDLVITGSNDPKSDVNAVQKAVDQGGSILLLGTFNFGEKGKIVLVLEG